MANSAIEITAGSGTPVDTFTLENSDHRQSVVIGSASVAADVAPVDATAGLKVNLGTDNDIVFTKAAVATITVVNDTASSTTLHTSNSSRLAIIILNASTVGLYVKYGTTASSSDYTQFLEAGEVLREELYTGRIDGIWESDASGAARITELTAS
jgi:hypothetical protein